jgi:MOSC domain-containing protein YiiM
MPISREGCHVAPELLVALEPVSGSPGVLPGSDEVDAIVGVAEIPDQHLGIHAPMVVHTGCFGQRAVSRRFGTTGTRSSKPPLRRHHGEMDGMVFGEVGSVHRSAVHGFSKAPVTEVELIAGLGVAGDAHCRATVQHRSRVAVDPGQPNLRQVHLVAGELQDELRERGFSVGPGDMGENITTRGVDLLALPAGTLLLFGESALVALAGLRNPCRQLDRLDAGLMSAVLARDQNGALIRRAGVMGIVVLGGAGHYDAGGFRPHERRRPLWPAEPACGRTAVLSR